MRGDHQAVPGPRLSVFVKGLRQNPPFLIPIRPAHQPNPPPASFVMSVAWAGPSDASRVAAVPKSRNGKGTSALYNALPVDGAFGAAMKVLTWADLPGFLDFLRAVWPAESRVPGNGECVVARTASGADDVKRVHDVE